MKTKGRIFITTAYTDKEPIASFLKALEADKVKNHEIVKDPAIADIIFFVENSRYHSDSFFTKLKNNELVKKYPEKTFMYNPHDKPWYILPGLYVSMPDRLFSKKLMVATSYIETINEYIFHDPSVTPQYLFSFVGKPNSKARRKILNIKNPRGMIKGTSNDMFNDFSYTEAKKEYAKILSQSKFILCPRGAGTSSFRIFETMQAGRVPVIISDEWVPPEGPSWDAFAVFITEDKIENIPDILIHLENQWQHKSNLARREWEIFFAPDVTFENTINKLLKLKQNASKEGFRFYFFQHVSSLKYLFRKTVIENIKRVFNYYKKIK